MGLGFSTEDVPYTEESAHWSYGGFGRFRRRLAAQIGIDLYSMEGFGGELSWRDFEDHSLYPLLNHSDCDGELTPEQCSQIIPALWLEIKKWPDHEYDTIQARLLIKHMIYCVEVGKALIFG